MIVVSSQLEAGVAQQAGQPPRQVRVCEVVVPLLQHAQHPLAVARVPDDRVPVGVEDQQAAARPAAPAAPRPARPACRRRTRRPAWRSRRRTSRRDTADAARRRSHTRPAPRAGAPSPACCRSGRRRRPSLRGRPPRPSRRPGSPARSRCPAPARRAAAPAARGSGAAGRRCPASGRSPRPAWPSRRRTGARAHALTRTLREPCRGAAVPAARQYTRASYDASTGRTAWTGIRSRATTCSGSVAADRPTTPTCAVPSAACTSER